MNAQTVRELAVAAGNAYQQAPPNGASILIDAVGQDRGFMLASDASITISIRGTVSIEDAETDAEVMLEHEEGGLVHFGFWREYTAIRSQVDAFIKAHPEATNIRVTGHSLGGAIATLIAENAFGGGRTVQLLTLGSPRVGNTDFCHAFDRLILDSVRVVHAYDLIPRVPKLGYDHVGGLLHLDDKGHPTQCSWYGVLWNDFVTRKSLADHHVMGYLCALEMYLKGMAT